MNVRRSLRQRLRASSRAERKPAPALRVFISYRREDSSGHAGRLYDDLADRFGEDQVFMDIDTIEPGVDFAEVIDRSVGSCDVLLALIGRRWVAASDPGGIRRLDKPEDWVRMELAHALERPDVRVVPVLVQGADMPSADALPEPLRKLALRNAIELSDERWHYDVGRLTRALETRDKASASPGDAATPPRHRPWRRRLAAASATLVVAAGAVAVTVIVAGSRGGSAPRGPSPQNLGGVTHQSGRVLPARGCADAASMRSRSATESTSIDFKNQTAKAVHIHWLNYSGKRERLGSLAPGETLSFSTYTTHPWLVADAAGRCIGLYLPARQPGRAIIAAPAACWTGTWRTSFNTMTLTQRGKAVSGNYRYERGRITGTVAGNLLRGTWDQADHTPGGGDGDVEFRMATDGNSFAGRWKYHSSRTWHDWTGTRVSPQRRTSARCAGR